jgi:hypothetical protein
MTIIKKPTQDDDMAADAVVTCINMASDVSADMTR